MAYRLAWEEPRAVVDLVHVDRAGPAREGNSITSERVSVRPRERCRMTSGGHESLIHSSSLYDQPQPRRRSGEAGILARSSHSWSLMLRELHRQTTLLKIPLWFWEVAIFFRLQPDAGRLRRWLPRQPVGPGRPSCSVPSTPEEFREAPSNSPPLSYTRWLHESKNLPFSQVRAQGDPNTQKSVQTAGSLRALVKEHPTRRSSSNRVLNCHRSQFDKVT
jgi:hypothetical protein